MTIYDIAKLAGVSKSTVSRVLNGESNVSLDAKTKVEQVVREHNYVPNRNAAMTRQSRQVILVLVTRLDSYSETRLIRGMMESATENTEFLISETQFDVEKTKQIVENNKNVNAIIVFAISGESYDFLENLLTPVVIVGQKLSTSRSNVYFDDYQSMHQLIKQSKINDAIFIGYNDADNTMMRRYEATCSALGCDVDYLTMTEYGHVQAMPSDKLDKYCNFVCATETIALETYKYILKNNLQNYKIISAGNNRNINFIIDHLSTVDFHYKQAGRDIITSLKAGQTINFVTRYSLISN